ncbi:MAG: CBS domain-containing protein [Planctomycetales bacterium]|nr:CBS domain-containing protein [Planctomycetales bacterium]
MDFRLNVDTETISQLSLEEPTCVTSVTSVRDVLRVLQQHRAGFVLVVDNEQLQGIFTERDALRHMATGEGLDEAVSAAMTSDVVLVEKTDTVASAIEKMARGGYRRLPVVDNGRPRGVLAVSTILHYLVEHFPEVVYTLPPHPDHSHRDREGA